MKAKKGFTLIELLVVMAVIAATIQIFLPAVQHHRELYNKQAAERELKVLAANLEQHYRKNGAFPASISFEAAGKSGYRTMIQTLTPQRVEIVNEPLAGVTGSETGVLQAIAGQVAVRFVPTPGADEARKRMLAAVRLHGAEAIANIGGLSPATFGQIKNYSEAAGTDRQAFDQLRGVDGRVGFESTRQYLAAQPFGSALWERIARAMQLGEYGETWSSIPGLDMLPAVQQDFHFFEWHTLAEITNALVGNAVLKQQLLGLVQSAAQAESRGDLAAKQKALATYRNVLETQQAAYFSTTDRLLNFSSAQVLQSMARVF